METVKKSAKSKFPVTVDAGDKSVGKSLTKLYSKTQLMLLLSNICALFSYILLLLVVVRLYACFEGQKRYLMIASMGTMYIFFAMLLWFAWRASIYKKSDSGKLEGDGLRLYLNGLTTQHQIRSRHLIFYAALLAVVSVVFFLDNKGGLTLILKLSAPLGVTAFLTGIYFIIKFKDQDSELQSFEGKTGFSN